MHLTLDALSSLWFKLKVISVPFINIKSLLDQETKLDTFCDNDSKMEKSNLIK